MVVSDQIEFSVRDHIGAHAAGAMQDIANSPTHRLLPLDFCGFLNRGMFDCVRARFVRQEVGSNNRSLIYDLSYWRADPPPYQRLWLNPDRPVARSAAVYHAHSSR